MSLLTLLGTRLGYLAPTAPASQGNGSRLPESPREQAARKHTTTTSTPPKSNPPNPASTTSTEPSSRTNLTLTTVFFWSSAGSSVGFVSWAHTERPARQQTKNKIARNLLEQRCFRRIFSQTKGSTGALPDRRTLAL